MRRRSLRLAPPLDEARPCVSMKKCTGFLQEDPASARKAALAHLSPSCSSWDGLASGGGAGADSDDDDQGSECESCASGTDVFLIARARSSGSIGGDARTPISYLDIASPMCPGRRASLGCPPANVCCLRSCWDSAVDSSMRTASPKSTLTLSPSCSGSTSFAGLAGAALSLGSAPMSLGRVRRSSSIGAASPLGGGAVCDGEPGCARDPSREGGQCSDEASGRGAHDLGLGLGSPGGRGPRTQRGGGGGDSLGCKASAWSACAALGGLARARGPLVTGEPRSPAAPRRRRRVRQPQTLLLPVRCVGRAKRSVVNLADSLVCKFAPTPFLRPSRHRLYANNSSKVTPDCMHHVQAFAEALGGCLLLTPWLFVRRQVSAGAGVPAAGRGRVAGGTQPHARRHGAPAMGRVHGRTARAAGPCTW